jgi:hypothetical protein
MEPDQWNVTSQNNTNVPWSWSRVLNLVASGPFSKIIFGKKFSRYVFCS